MGHPTDYPKNVYHMLILVTNSLIMSKNSKILEFCQIMRPFEFWINFRIFIRKYSHEIVTPRTTVLLSPKTEQKRVFSEVRFEGCFISVLYQNDRFFKSYIFEMQSLNSHNSRYYGK